MNDPYDWWTGQTLKFFDYVTFDGSTLKKCYVFLHYLQKFSPEKIFICQKRTLEVVLEKDRTLLILVSLNLFSRKTS